jgi:hypothetical protein
MKKTMVVSLALCLLLLAGVCAHAKKKQVVKTMGGAMIPSIGISIDASYDPEFDNFVPGYKMLNVAILNNSFNIIEMNPEKDQWWITTKKGEKKYRAICNLRGDDPSAWNGIADKARNLISYPLLLPIGARQVIDIFVPDKVPVADFRGVVIYINSLNTTIEVTARQ